MKTLRYISGIKDCKRIAPAAWAVQRHLLWESCYTSRRDLKNLAVEQSDIMDRASGEGAGCEALPMTSHHSGIAVEGEWTVQPNAIQMGKHYSHADKNSAASA